MKPETREPGYFVWVAPHNRVGRFGGAMPPRTPELRTPWLWLARDGQELFLVNNTPAALREVTIWVGGSFTHDDGAASVGDNQTRATGPVPSLAAVKVDEYDDFYDLDYLLGVSLSIDSEQLGLLHLETPLKKGGLDETILLWNSGELGKNIKRLAG
ncbi:hypothetical protein [Lampropedia aestuarii]|uniref:hypothetical protein n=1 Tax=Lampropedia aestuarii TaxID=2562762 RepID=UPI00246822F0|nr:hypothetical protein [Lampropedia aestuarii]MDH5859177.1 hypothetical protein [Lampropedia aestuarii]